MSQKEKLLLRLLSKPKDFKYDEARTLLRRLGYFEDTNGKTSGSSIKFVHAKTRNVIMFHKPHDNILKGYMINAIINGLKEIGEL